MWPPNEAATRAAAVVVATSPATVPWTAAEPIAVEASGAS
jgi:hypothetical protein